MIPIHQLVIALTKALATNDSYTAEHSNKVSYYALKMAQRLNLDKNSMINIQMGALLHDIGKIGVSKSILNKPGRLTQEEYQEIKKHPEIGFDIVSEINELVNLGLGEIILYHHEQFDGKGYPLGLAGDSIPLGARIISVCDAFDAMTSVRPYRKGIPIDKALDQLRAYSGTQFDPELVEVLIQCLSVDNYNESSLYSTAGDINEPFSFC